MTLPVLMPRPKPRDEHVCLFVFHPAFFAEAEMEVECGEPSPETGHEFAEEEARTSDECVEPSPVEGDTPGTTHVGEVETKKMEQGIDDSMAEDPKKGTYKELSHLSLRMYIYIYIYLRVMHNRHCSCTYILPSRTGVLF